MIPPAMTERYDAVSMAASMVSQDRRGGGWTNIGRRGESVLVQEQSVVYAVPASGDIDIYPPSSSPEFGSGNTTSLHVVEYRYVDKNILVPDTIAWMSGFVDRTNGHERQGEEVDTVLSHPMYRVLYIAKPGKMEVGLDAGDYPSGGVVAVNLRDMVLEPNPWQSMVDRAEPSDIGGVQVTHIGSLKPAFAGSGRHELGKMIRMNLLGQNGTPGALGFIYGSLMGAMKELGPTAE